MSSYQARKQRLSYATHSGHLLDVAMARSRPAGDSLTATYFIENRVLPIRDVKDQSSLYNHSYNTFTRKVFAL